MQEEKDINQVALETLTRRITEVFPMQIRACIEELTEEQLWWRPNDQSNSVGNLVLHLSGSLRHYLSRGVGGMEYERNRPAEFAERGPMPKEDVLANFNETIRQASVTLEGFDTGRFTETTDEPSYNLTIFELLLGIATHLAIHTGQIVYITKMLKEGSIDEVWIRAHKS